MTLEMQTMAASKKTHAFLIGNLLNREILIALRFSMTE